MTREVFVGIDPSFTSTGLCIVDSLSKVITLTNLSYGKTLSKDFATVFRVASEFSNTIVGFILRESILNNCDFITSLVVTSEMPSAFGYSILPLVTLDTVLYLRLLGLHSLTSDFKFYATPTVFPKFIINSKKADKKQCVLVAKTIIDSITEHSEWVVDQRSKFTSDEAEALFISLKGLVLSSPNHELIPILKEVCPRLFLDSSFSVIK